MAGDDKLAAMVGGRPVLAWALDSLAAAPEVERVVLVATPERCDALGAGGWLPAKVAATVVGGPRRQESVAAGLAALRALDDAGIGSVATTDRVVLIHDGPRPLVSPALVARVADAAVRHGAAIPVTPVVETLKRLEGDRVAGTVDRTFLGASQTPQGFLRSVLSAALTRFPADGPDTWTDEAALLEACGMTVHAVPGDPTNLKVTYPDDLARIAAHLPRRAETGPAPRGGPPRVGLGEDLHSFGPGGPLVLGGVAFPGAPRLHGHSDGDVALHAVADALLGAAGLGDLGRVAPAGPETPRGVDSRILLERVLSMIHASGWVPASVDITIVGARPRLGARLSEVAESVAGILGIPPGNVDVKASTGNLIGAEGAGRAIGARAVAVLVPAVSEPTA